MVMDTMHGMSNIKLLDKFSQCNKYTKKIINEHDFLTAFSDITYNANGLMVLHCYNVFCVEAPTSYCKSIVF